jgi:hypothetical protein
MTDTTIAAFDDTIAGGVRQDGQCQLEERLVPGRRSVATPARRPEAAQGTGRNLNHA